MPPPVAWRAFAVVLCAAYASVLAVDAEGASGAALRSQQPEGAGPRLLTRSDGATTTTHTCTRLGAWGSVCVYHDICYNGTEWWFLDPHVKQMRPEAVTFTGQKDMVDGYLVPSGPVIKPEEQLLPFNSGAKGRFVDPSLLSSPSVHAVWSSQTLWRPALDAPLSNIWYFAARVMPLFKLRRMNESSLLRTPLPSMDENDLLLLVQPDARKRYASEWHQTVLAVATGGRVPTATITEEWNTQWSSTRPVCFKNAVLTGAFAYAVPDIQTGFEFREAMFRHMGIVPPKKPVNKALFWLRPVGAPRELLNIKQVLKLVDSYNVSYTVIDSADPPPFKEQLELFANHGIFVTPHGPALTNMMFMVPFTGVVEMFPYHMDNTLYPVLASHVGLGNYPVHAVNGSHIWTQSPEYAANHCDELPALALFAKSPKCRQAVVNSPFEIGLRQFEAAFVNAVQHAGFRLRFQNIRPRVVPGTLTGFG